MTYDQLVAFLAVAAEGSFVAASQRLHKSQPAVSKLVRNLEAELGVELFDRQAYRATLSDAGRLFCDRALAVVDGTEALRSFGLALAGRVEPVVRLAVDAVAPLAPILDALRRVGDRHPTVRFELHTERLAGAAEALRQERAELAVATLLGAGTSAFEMVPHASVRVVPVVRRDHPLAAGRGPALPALLRAHPQVVLRDSAQDAAAPSLNVLSGGLRWSVSDVAAKKEVILAGMGWGGLPAHVVAEELAAGTLVPLQVAGFAPVMELYVLRCRDRRRGVVAQALWDELVAAATAAQPADRGRGRRSGKGIPAASRAGRTAGRRPAR